MSISRADMILSANRAFLGEISPKLREVKMFSDEHFIHLRFIYDSDLDDNDRDSANTISGTIAADFPSYRMKDEILTSNLGTHTGPSICKWETMYARR